MPVNNLGLGVKHFVQGSGSHSVLRKGNINHQFSITALKKHCVDQEITVWLHCSSVPSLLLGLYIRRELMLLMCKCTFNKKHKIAGFCILTAKDRPRERLNAGPLVTVSTSSEYYSLHDGMQQMSATRFL